MRFRRDRVDLVGFTHLGNDSSHACRLGNFDDNTTDGRGAGASVPGANTVEQCQDACMKNPACKAIEWKDRALTQPTGGKKCEVWTQAPGYTDWVSDHICMTFTPGEALANTPSVEESGDDSSCFRCRTLVAFFVVGVVL